MLRKIICSLVPALALCLLAGQAKADTILDFSDVPPGTLSVFNPYISQGFTLTSSAGGFVFNSPDTGNGSPQTIGNNPFYAGANGLASFAPATITLAQTGGAPFSLTAIDLARLFAFDPAPSVTFTGALNGGGTVVQTFTVTTTSPPLVFQTFNLVGFDNLASVSWDQGAGAQGLHQFSNIHLTTAQAAAPEPGTGMLLASLCIPALLLGRRRRA